MAKHLYNKGLNMGPSTQKSEYVSSPNFLTAGREYSTDSNQEAMQAAPQPCRLSWACHHVMPTLSPWRIQHLTRPTFRPITTTRSYYCPCHFLGHDHLGGHADTFCLSDRTLKRSKKATYGEFVKETPAQLHRQKVLHSYSANDLRELGRVTKRVGQPELKAIRK